MKPPRVLIVSDQCSLRGERYLAAKLEDDTYAFVKGNVPVLRRQTLPMDSGEAGKIKHPLDLSALRRKWNDVARGSTRPLTGVRRGKPSSARLPSYS